MNMPIVLLIISVVVSFGINLLLIPILLRISHWRGWYDEVDHRKIHKGNIPRLGGVGIFSSFIFGLIIFFILKHFFYPDFRIPKAFSLWPVIGGLIIIHVLGLIDDFRNIRPWLKIIVQLIAAGIVAFFGNRVTMISLPSINISLQLGSFSYVFTVLWIIGISNAVNLIDGLDGLAGGTIAIAALFISSIALLQQSYIIAAAGIILFGSLIGFLVFNFPPAKIFMGDSGSLFIGFFIAVLPLFSWHLPSKTSSLFVVTIALCAIPIFDTLGAIFRRISQRRPIHSPDKSHIHHKLLELGLKNRGVLFVAYGASAVLGITCLLSFFFVHFIFNVLIAVALVLLIIMFALVNRAYKKTASG